MQLKYPALKRDDRKTVKIKTTEYDRIFHLYWTDTPIYLIAILYNVNHKTISGILFPERRRKAYDKSLLYFRQYRTIPEYYENAKRISRNFYHSDIKNRNGMKEYQSWYGKTIGWPRRKPNYKNEPCYYKNKKV